MALSWTVNINSFTAKLRLSTARPTSQPRIFPSEGFDAIGKDQLVEEEIMPEYNSEHFYPVRLGEVFNDRFQTVAKLGYGSSLTIWLARDLQWVAHEIACDRWLTIERRDHQYVALKIYIHNSVQHRELPFYKHLNKILPSNHPGGDNVRKLLGSLKSSVLMASTSRSLFRFLK